MKRPQFSIRGLFLFVAVVAAYFGGREGFFGTGRWVRIGTTHKLQTGNISLWALCDPKQPKMTCETEYRYDDTGEKYPK